MRIRETAVTGESITLEWRHYVNGALADVHAISRIDIYSGDPRVSINAVLVQSIFTANITHVSTGVYQYTMEAVSVAGYYYDKVTYQLVSVGALYTDYDTVHVQSGCGESVTIGLRNFVGWTFENYVIPNGQWGEVITADDMRYTYLFGNTLKGTDGNEAKDSQLRSMVRLALERVESELGIDIRRRKYVSRPEQTTPALTRTVQWSASCDYTDEDAPYEFNPHEYSNFGFVQLRHYPVVRINKVSLYSPLDQFIMDVSEWERLDKRAGQVHLYPKIGSLGYAPLYSQSPFWSYMRTTRYPAGWRIDYETGYETSEFVPGAIREVIANIATIGMLQWVGDGLLAGFSSSSISLDGISESFSSTQSATSAYYGARIIQLQGVIKDQLKECRHKFSNVPMAFA